MLIGVRTARRRVLPLFDFAKAPTPGWMAQVIPTTKIAFIVPLSKKKAPGKIRKMKRSIISKNEKMI